VHHCGERHRVVELRDHTARAHPVRGVLRPKIDHQNSGARLRPLGRERRIEPKPLEILDPVD
jgi:hypothetical protein